MCRLTLVAIKELSLVRCHPGASAIVIDRLRCEYRALAVVICGWSSSAGQLLPANCRWPLVAGQLFSDHCRGSFSAGHCRGHLSRVIVASHLSPAVCRGSSSPVIVSGPHRVVRAPRASARVVQFRILIGSVNSEWFDSGGRYGSQEIYRNRIEECCRHLGFGRNRRVGGVGGRIWNALRLRG